MILFCYVTKERPGKFVLKTTSRGFARRSQETRQFPSGTLVQLSLIPRIIEGIKEPVTDFCGSLDREDVIAATANIRKKGGVILSSDSRRRPGEVEE